jgi:hypothetical protein
MRRQRQTARSVGHLGDTVTEVEEKLYPFGLARR